MSEDLGAGGFNHLGIAAYMITVLVGIDYLRDLPAFVARRSEAFLVVQWIDCKSLAGLRAGDEIVEVSVRVARPDLLYDHWVGLLS